MKDKKEIIIYENEPPIYGEKIYSQEIPSDLNEKNKIINNILEILASHKIYNINEEDIWIRLCIDEILTNAITHGNKEDKNKKVKIELYLDKKKWILRVEDEGEGFSIKDIPKVSEKDYWELEHGRGILLVQSYMDEVFYYDKGCKVQLTKFIDSPIKRKFKNIMKKISKFFKI